MAKNERDGENILMQLNLYSATESRRGPGDNTKLKNCFRPSKVCKSLVCETCPGKQDSRVKAISGKHLGGGWTRFLLPGGGRWVGGGWTSEAAGTVKGRRWKEEVGRGLCSWVGEKEDMAEKRKRKHHAFFMEKQKVQRSPGGEDLGRDVIRDTSRTRNE